MLPMKFTSWLFADRTHSILTATDTDCTHPSHDAVGRRVMSVFLIMPLLVCMAQSAQAVQSAGSAGTPSPTELAVLDWVNQYRLDPRSAEFVTSGVLQEQMDRKTPVVGIVTFNDWNSAVVRSEAPHMKPKGVISPVVLNPALMAAARAILNSKVAWVDKSPLSFAEPFRVAGYTPTNKGLILLGRNASSVRIAFVQAITNVMGEMMWGPANNQHLIPVFVGRHIGTAEWHEAGVAVDESGGKVSLVVVLGTGSAERYLGGTVFSDANHNGTYDAGEAKGGVKVSVGDLSTSSGPTGYWSLAVKATEPLDVVFSIDDLHGTRSIPSGPCSVLVNWRVPKAADLITVKKLISEAEKDATSTDEGKRRKALSALLAGARMIPLDDSLQRQVDQLTQPIREDYDELIRKVLNSLGEDPQGFKRRMNELKLPWK